MGRHQVLTKRPFNRAYSCRKPSSFAPIDGDVEVLCQAWGLNNTTEIKCLKAIAATPGALRGVVKTYRLAAITAAGKNEKVTLDHLKRAWKDLNGDSMALRRA